MAIIKKIRSNKHWQGCGEKELVHSWWELYIGAVGNSIKAPKETKNWTTVWSKNSTPGYILEENENTYSKR